MITEENGQATVLPNPDGMWDGETQTFIPREQCAQQCAGCKKMFSDHDMGDVCIAYISPKAHWRNYRIEVDKLKDNKEIEYHYNPCGLATHIKHSPKFIAAKGRSGWKKGKSWSN